MCREEIHLFGFWTVVHHYVYLLYEKLKLNFTQMSKDKGSVAKGQYKKKKAANCKMFYLLQYNSRLK